MQVFLDNFLFLLTTDNLKTTMSNSVLLELKRELEDKKFNKIKKKQCHNKITLSFYSIDLDKYNWFYGRHLFHHAVITTNFDFNVQEFSL